MRGLLEQVEQRGDGEQEQELKEWAEKLKDVALDAKNVIETFVIKSVKRRRWGVLHWYDKYKVGKELEEIRKRMRDISQKIMNLNLDVSVSVETPVVRGEALPPSCSTIVEVAMEKLDQIRSRQNLITSNKVIEMVEEVKDGLKDLKNIVSKLKSTNQRETVWLEEVNEVCNYSEKVAGNFISTREKWLKMYGWKKVLYLYEGYASVWEFKSQMRYIRSCEIGDTLQRGITYGVVGDTHEIKTQRSTVPVPNLSVESLIVWELIPFAISFAASFLVPDNSGNTWNFLYVFLSQTFEVVAEQGARECNITKTRRKLEKTNEKTGRKGRAILRRLIRSIIYYTYINLPVLILSLYLPLQVVLIFQLYFPLRDVIVWIVKLWRSMDNNLKCTQRDLALMHAFLRDIAAESEQVPMNERQKVWVEQLRIVAQNGKSLLDAAAKGGCWRRRIMFPKDINCFLDEILNLSHRKTVYGISNIIIQQGTQQNTVVRSCPSINNTVVRLCQSINMHEERVIQRIVEQHGYISRDMEGNPAPEPAASSSYRPVTGLKQEVQSIREEEELMFALFQDVLEMRDLDRRSTIWVEQMHGIVNEIESVIQRYDAKLKYKSILLYTLKFWTRHVISEEINAIRNKIEDASRRRRAYGLGKTIESSMSSTVHILRGTAQLSLVAKESNVVGFDDDAQVLMAQLLSDEKSHCITWIVGIGGTGKTTLARLIFKDKAVGDHFECCLWVSVSSTSESNSHLNSNCTAQQLFEEIAKEASKQIEGADSPSEPMLKTLARKRYLIVVDGIEETSQVYLLDTLKDVLPDMSTGSRLLLTARNANIARHAAGTITTFVHPLQLLDDDSSWVLFTRHLKVDIPKEELKKVRREIVKCGGLPSEILKLSNLLSHEEEWSSMLNQEQIQSQIQAWSETVNEINKHLPLYLRGCLFYFGLFPAEFGIPIRRLVALLVAEERVHHGEDQEPPEQVAEGYLTKLIDQNLVQIAKRKRNGKVKTCRLPYALRQLWWTKANESIFLKSKSTSTDSNADPNNSIIRWVTDHLNTDHIWYDHIHGDTHNTRNKSVNLRTYYHDVRSFLSFDTREGSKPGQEVGYFLRECILGDCFLLLRVLDLERVYKPKLPKSIARLSQLRYLGLRWTYLESLPSFISRLLKLQTLDLKYTYIHTLPTSIWEMDLRHLFLSDTFHSRFPAKQKDPFSAIRFLLPQVRDNFLYDLQTLWGLFVDEETPVKDGLDTLVNITKLGLACQQMSLEEEAMPKQLEVVADWIAKLEHLQSLRLKSRDEEGKPWILPLKSFEKNENLTDMYLLGSLSRSSIVSQFPKSLVELTLSHSKLKEDPMKLLKYFSELRILCLLADSYMGHTMVCESQSFPKLHALKFWVLKQLEEWKIEQGALPCLRQLEIRLCPNLKMLPNGLKHVNTLLELKLTDMPREINDEAQNIPTFLPNCRVV
ncbi:putative disease resistance RPP13-like protein 3 [Medicago truncatula]|nr:putative disease resistance RPP13-like protein 3 [Medicago truncatula]